MQEPIISVSGLRGVIGESLSPELAMRFSCAFAGGLSDGSVLVTRDGRSTGSMLALAIQAGLMAMGRDVIDGGVAATPTTGVLVRAGQAAGGIQISASHNPPSYNGIKLFSPQGQVLSAAEGEAVVHAYRQGTLDWVAYEAVGKLQPAADTIGEHLQLVLASVDVERIRSKKFRVLLDSNHGAGSLLGRRLLDELGCEVVLLGGEPDGAFEHPPEPTAENLAGVQTQVREHHARIGFCQDPDADRLAIVDEAGRYIGEEYTLALCLDHVLRRQPGVVVTNCATSRMADDVARKHGARCVRSAVGEANVVAQMRHEDAVFGGEGNGGPIDPRVGYVRDSFVGMATVLDAMAAREATVSDLANELPRYEIVKQKVDLEPSRLDDAFGKLVKHFHDATSSRLDGLRLDWDDRWVLVRPSNTEPIVRVIAEAPRRATALKLCEEVSQTL